MYKIYADGNLIHYGPLFTAGYLVIDPIIKKDSLYSQGSLTFTMPPDHPYYDDIAQRTTIVRVLDDTEELFRGRVISAEKDFYNQKEIYCEGELAFLVDSYYRPFGFTGSLADFFAALVENHNSQVDETRQFEVGEVTVAEPEGGASWAAETAQSTWDILNNELIENYGGYLRVRLENGVRYLDYIADYTTYSSQKIKFGENLLDLSDYVSGEGIITCLIPYGAAYEDEDEDYTEQPENGTYNGNRLTIESVTDNGADYVTSSGGVALYGQVWGTYTWEDVTDPAELKELAQDYVDSSILATTITITALDLHLTDVDVSRIHHGDYVRVVSRPHDLSLWLQCTAIEMPLENPEDTKITLGAGSATLTSSVAGGVYNRGTSTIIGGSSGEVATLSARLALIESAYITSAEVESLIAESATITTLSAQVAAIEEAYITTASVETLLASYATIENLNTVEANITTLLVDYATIDSLTAVQADITQLNADIADINNLFADYATITYLQANYASIDDLTAAEANITQLTADVATINNLFASYATIAYLEAYYATIDQLDAAYADITVLDADVASIRTLLAGNESVETLQAIHLTSDNVVIDDAIITSAMIVSLSADKITTGTIYTNYVNIQSETGNLYIADNTIQIQDDASTVRVQIGEDASGDYNLYLWDASGTLIWNAAGLTAEGLTGNGAIIKDMAVADDANIQGSKLDIDSVISYIEENGSLTVDYANVTIDNTTLSAWYATVNTSVSNLESTTSTLQTELTEVNGQITAKVWQTDITEAISGISIGGRNYLTDTRDFDSGTWVNSHSAYFSLEEDDEGYTAATFAEYSTLTWRYVQSSANPILFSTLRGQDVVLSFELRSDDYEAINDSTSEGAHITFALCTGDSTSRTLYKNVTMYTEELSDEWQKFTIAVTLSDSYFSSGSGTIDDDTRFYVQFYDRSTYSMQIRKFKLELGTVATDWTPAPEDAESSITSLHDQYTTVTQTISGIETEIGDISTTVEDNYTSLSSKITTISETVDGITTTVSELETTVGDNYDTLSSQITTVETTVNGITTTVSELETTVADNYKTLSNQITTVETTVNGITTTVSELETTVDSYYTTLSGKITTVETTASGLSATIAEVQNVVAENLIVDGTFDGYTTFGSAQSWYRTSSSHVAVTTYDDKPCVKYSYAGAGTVYIRQTVNLPAGSYIVKVKLACGEDYLADGENYAPIAHARFGSNNDIELNGSGDLTTEWATYSATVTLSSACTYFYLRCYASSTVTTEMYATDIAVYESVELTETYSQITQLADSISMSVTGSLGGTASIVLSANGSSTTETLDLSNVRSAFAEDTTAITISAGTITFASNTLIIDSTQLTLDSGGNATFSGTLSAAGGTFTGELSAATGTFSGALSAATGTFSGALTAATGTFCGDVTAYSGVTLGGNLSVYKNYVVNGDFIGFSDSWSTTNDTGWYRYPVSSTYIYGTTYKGVECACMMGTGTGYYIRQYQSGGLAAGTYIVKARIAAESGSQPYAYVRARIGTSSAGVYGYLCSAGDLAEDWQTFYTEITTSTTYSYINIFAYGGTSYPYYITDIEVINKEKISGYIGYLTGSADGETTDGIGVMNSTKENYFIATNAGARMSAGETSVGLVTDAGITLTSATTINANVSVTVSSDRALKNHIEALPDAYETLFDRMEPVRYYLNHEQDNRYHLGYIANDVLEAAADAGLTWDDTALINQNPETGLLGLNYAEIVALQHQKIKKLEQRIETLERAHSA